ncbi:MAG: DNA methyltransferase [Deltaproteobacteria bacterium]|nr:DNA methyltransferase [Deltaproteobacteria bacterium]
MNPLETYLRELYDIRSTGAATPETAYYPPLSNLLNEIGKTLKPKVRCIINLKNRGAGLPDGGLFTPDQFKKDSSEPIPTIAARGVIEVKPTNVDAWLTAEGEQVSRYWGKYRQVLVTNLRDFLLVGQDAEGRQVKLEAFRLAPTEADFWREAAHPRRLAAAQGERCLEFLKRVMLQAAPLASPKEVAWFLASYARDAKARIEQQGALPALETLRAALEEALGLKFEGTKADPEKGEHFFRSTLVQTIFYGVFSAWVLWSKKHPPTDLKAKFRWREAAWHLHVPMIRALFEQLATPAKLGPLNLVEVLDWTEACLNRVSRTDFFAQFEEGHAVQYFYEPFLEAFDPKLRKDLGVWYTPPEIVQYMVARVDTVLRQELDIGDGLADPRVYVLDPCCGTGAYLVEVLKSIHATLQAQGGNGLMAHKVKLAALSRVFGFEIMPAPFVVAHLQLGLYLQNLGAPLAEETPTRKGERPGVYLTNALTGWEPPTGPKKQLIFPEMQEERDAAEDVKRDKPILVILGNPPYNAFAGVSPKEETGLVEPYKEGLISRWGIKKFNLDNLYIRFFGLAERRIAQMTGKGVVSYISMNTWVSEPSLVVLRQRLMNSFDRFWIENMHGDRTISEYAPDGKTSETIFAIPGFSPGIRQGIVISLWVKSGKGLRKPQILYRDNLHAAKAVERRAQLLESLKDSDFGTHYQPAEPEESNKFSFQPIAVSAAYMSWPRIDELASFRPTLGILENRKEALIDIDSSELEKRIKLYYDPTIEWDELKKLGTGLTEDFARFDAKKTRLKVLSQEVFNSNSIRRVLIRPMDLRFCYYTSVRPLWNESRPDYFIQCWPGNASLVSRKKGVASPEGVPFHFTSVIGLQHALHTDAYYFTLRLRTLPKNNQGGLFSQEATGKTSPTANLSPAARTYLAALGLPDPDAAPDTASLIWMHALAVGYAPAYLTENADGIRQDWPRVPLPDTAEALKNSAQLGRRVAALLDTETQAPGVTAGALRPEMKFLSVISKEGGGPLNPDAGDLALIAGWGHGGKDGVTMPGKGRAVKRDYSPEELAAIREGAAALGLTVEAALEHLGESTYDIYLNDAAYWRNIPEKVWNYYIGGYQVIKKWLSYREQPLLGRPLSPDEVEEVTHMARRLTAIVLMETALNDNYQALKKSTYLWQDKEATIQ